MSVASEELLQIARLRTAFFGGELTAGELIEQILMRIAIWDDPALWITRTSDAALRQRATELDSAAAANPALITPAALWHPLCR